MARGAAPAAPRRAGDDAVTASALLFIGLLVAAAAALILLGVRLASSARSLSHDSDESPETEPTNIRRALVITGMVILLFGGVATGIIAGCSALVRTARTERDRMLCQGTLAQIQWALGAYQSQYDAYPGSMRDVAAAAAKAAAAAGTAGTTVTTGPGASAPVAAPAAAWGWGLTWPLPSVCPVSPGVRYLYVGGADVRHRGRKVLVIEEEAAHGGRAHIITGHRGGANVESVAREEFERLLDEWRSQAPPYTDGSW